MSTEFIFTREMKPRDVHIGICENMIKVLYGASDEAGEEERDQFTARYQAALKAGFDQLATFVIEQGRDLIKTEPNSSHLSY